MGVYEDVAAYLPPALRKAALEAAPHLVAAAEEFRLRCGRFLTIVSEGRESILPARVTVRNGDISAVLDRATDASIHSHMDKLKQGFITLSGGHRIGVCGTTVMRDGEPALLRDISSLSLRIARAQKGVSDELARTMLTEGLHNTLIISPPGLGKTTFLRDMIRNLAGGMGAFRVSVADERGELAGMRDGYPAFDIGEFSDVMDSCPKSYGMLMLLRSMSPQVLCADEIATEEDMRAARAAVSGGVRLICTVHGSGPGDIWGTADGLTKLFARVVTIFMHNGKRKYKMEVL